MNFIDLFAGAGGLSEGFKKAGFKPVAHVELDMGACYTLKTRISYDYLKENNRINEYYSYLRGEINRKIFYSRIPENLLSSVINASIGKDNRTIFSKIDNLLNNESVDLLIGGPPCQAYSSLNRGNLNEKEAHDIKDERTTFYKQYASFLRRYRPKLFVFENVPGIKTAGEGKYYKDLKKHFKKIGYTVDDRQLNSFDFGVIQNRERLIIIGWRDDIDFTYPAFKKQKHSWNRNTIFWDLPPIKPGHTDKISYYCTETNDYLQKNEIRNGIDFISQHISRPHNSKDLIIYKLAIQKLAFEGKQLKNSEIPEDNRTQKNITDFLDRFKVVDLKPHTMIAHIAKDGHHFIHPDEKQLRSISIREAARIQSFPDDFYFESIKENQPRTAAFRQIGNAVPPLMAYKIAVKIRSSL